MEALFIVIPLGIVLVSAAVWSFLWATGEGQFDDLDTPALRVLSDDEDHTSRRSSEHGLDLVQEQVEVVDDNATSVKNRDARIL